MAHRLHQLSEIQSFIGKVDTELTMVLQHLQWDRKHLLEGKSMVDCKYDPNHRVFEGLKDAHEQKCLLTNLGYSEDDVMLPDPLDTNANALITLNKSDIRQIINKAAQSDPTFKKGVSSTQNTESVDREPLTLDRLQATYSQDERRALHDAVVTAVPFCHDLSDLALPSENGQASSSIRPKSRVEILAELRDMKRRRTKYRVSAKTRNYSDVLRDVIKTQMEVYSEVKEEKLEQPETTSKRHNFDDVVDKYPSNSSQRHTNDFERKSYHQIHRSGGSRDSYGEDYSTSHKRRRTDDLVQYPDPKEYKHNKYNTDRISSKRSWTQGYDEYSESKQRYRRETSRNDRCSSKTFYDEVKKEQNSGSEDDVSTKHKKSRDRHSSKHRSRFDESEHKSDRYNERTKEYDTKRDRKYDHRSKESKKYERKEEDNYRRERHSSSKKSSRHSKDNGNEREKF